jgi:hypothetical protein
MSVAALQTTDLSQVAFATNTSSTTVFQILLYDASTLGNDIYSNTTTDASGTVFPYFLTVNAYLANQAFLTPTGANRLLYGEYVGDFLIPAAILPSSGVGNIYLTISPAEFGTGSDTSGWNVWSINSVESVDVVVSLEVNGSTTMSPVYNIQNSQFGAYAYSNINTYSLVIPLSNMFTNISLTNILYRFTVYVYPIYS